ncbi:uncharacterized protein [Rutidosis leptorrhynchoides]|uniref:uncharacterized protein n=1 Tax=Rutidosis leptorrhynchoides TaxID=125765 RepID=UPI003A9A4824
MKLLNYYEMIFGLKVNFTKSCLHGVGVPTNSGNEMAKITGCSVGSLPFTYPGIPIGCEMNKSKEWELVVEKFKYKLSDLKAKTTLYGGRITLIKSVLSSLLLYAFSLFRTPSCVINMLEVVKQWKDLWIRNQQLCERFGRVFRLDADANAIVAARLTKLNDSWAFSWDWCREPRYRSLTELLTLKELLTGFKYNDKEKDTWA